VKKACLFRIVAVFLTAAFMVLTLVPPTICNQPDSQETNIAPEYIVYYFYTSKRCTTCRKIEQFSEEAVKQKLKVPVEAGKVQWKTLNIEIPENEHFVKDFQLYTKSVIVAEYKDGKPVRWENLPDIWKLVRNREQFVDYVAGETRRFMGNN